jgi:hypothetical protein
MTQRERTLGIVVGSVVLTVAAVFIVIRVSTAFENRDQELSKLDREKKQKDRTVQAGERAVRQLKEFEKRSLPGDPSLAGSLYSQWLLKEAVAAGIASQSGSGVTLGPVVPRGDVYTRHTFLIDGQADLRQVAHFLYKFHSVGYLHRISRMNLKPLTGKKQLDVNITVEALSLKDAPNPKELTPPPSDRLAGESIESYVAAITGRNLFAPANTPPRIEVSRSQRGNPKRSISFTAKGSDADPLDQLSWAFDGPVPDGAKLDAKSGEFRWTPDKTGQYEVAIRVTDDGIPAKSAVEKVKIEVVDAPPESPKPKKLDFDPAQHSFVTAILQSNGKWQVWVAVRTEGKILRFEEGDKVSVGSLNAVVKNIRSDEAEFSLDDGRSLTVSIGKSLATEELKSGG